MEHFFLLQCATAPFTMFALYKGAYILGRSSKCHFAVMESGISRRHAELTVSGQGILVKDLGSLNGTYVEGVRVEESRVKSGQAIRFANATFVLTIETDQDLAIEEDTDPRDQSAQTPEPGAEVLSYSQLKVYRHLLKGWHRQKIAQELTLSRHTIDFHVSSILRAFHVKSTPELLAKQLQKNGE